MSSKKFYALILLFAAALTGCGSPAQENGTPMASAVTLESPWARASDSAMTAVFGTLTAAGDREVHLVGASSPAAGRVEIHEIARGAGGMNTMQAKAGGITIPPGESHELAPGGDHLMLMELTGPLRPGADVELTLAFEDGSTLPVTAQVRDFAGGDEEYSGDHHGHG
ncbi:copper chaperone PCu(A)C [Mycobacterium sp. ITM-2016-00317]|uniref:copper chaperone PCu(A)C n=1 Tax=Mycobacterium sp. ITM-2016-00317 TaxID=2099694 RepID=UPI00287F4930|nr:copper chaperone PCu(A)C [Mycobacterium sp. ITM-2016-00317]WNG89455.1 copper chaperone PCu(A)C [Mycobacterium sp. ITM-2016-00317]